MRPIGPFVLGSGDGGINTDPSTLAIETDDAGDEGVEREVGPLADIETWVEFGADLSDQDIPGDNGLSAELLHAATLGV